MKKTTRKTTKSAVATSRVKTPRVRVGSEPSARPRRAVNLTLDQHAIDVGERFASRHGVSVSSLVSGFLRSLPDADDGPRTELAPPVARLYGLLSGHDATRETYRTHMAQKYGVR